MFAILYRFQLQPHQEAQYQLDWQTVASYFIEHRGALGSCLHKGADGLWVGYSRWPDKATRDAAWPGDAAPNNQFPEAVRTAIHSMQELKTHNQHLQQYDEIYLEVMQDLLVNGPVMLSKFSMNSVNMLVRPVC